ncbi:MAG: hypothetical protein WC400_00840 [Patescibacteria group bacterium]|jgi:hypothetical protein
MNNLKPSNTESQFVAVAIAFCLIGLALLLSVMIWHQQINEHPWFATDLATTENTSNLQIATVPVVTPPTAAANSSAVPDSIIKEITTDPRNRVGYTKPAEELSPAVKFLYTLESPNIFPSQL